MSGYPSPSYQNTGPAFYSIEQTHAAEPLIHWASRMAGYASLAAGLILGICALFVF
ncbi:hypothetical protein [Sphingobium sp.]|uniref:hypothetical protein n=1 Tax=Sphingobium sp. TaxID=1912891 RepID=UPI003BB7173D